MSDLFATTVPKTLNQPGYNLKKNRTVVSYFSNEGNMKAIKLNGVLLQTIGLRDLQIPGIRFNKRPNLHCGLLLKRLNKLCTHHNLPCVTIGHFTVMDGVASVLYKPACFIMQIKLFLCYKLVFFKSNFHNKAKEVCIKKKSPSASHSLEG